MSPTNSAKTDTILLQVTPAAYFGRTALIVLLVATATSCAILGMKHFTGADPYDSGVLTILSGIIGVVGLLWAIVLMLRGAVRGEPLVWPFVVVLILLWAASIPMIGTWNDPDRGSENNWSYFHFICLPLLVPLLAISFTVALPVFTWKYVRAVRSETVQCVELKRNAWLCLILFSGLSFFGILPFAFYTYGATMGSVIRGQHWTLDASRKMPRWFGDYIFKITDMLPERFNIDIKYKLVTRGLVSQEFLLGKIEDTGLTDEDKEIYFRAFAREYSADALEWVRSQFNHNPPINLNYDTAGHFAEFASDPEVRPLLELPRFEALNESVKRGLIRGLIGRKNAKEYLPAVEALMAGSENTFDLTWEFLECHADDETGKRLYINMIGVRDLWRVTLELTIRPRGEVIAAALMISDAAKQRLVMEALLRRTSITPGSQVVRQRKVPAYRTAFSRLLDSPEMTNRVLAALLVHQYSFEMSPAIVQHYGLQKTEVRILDFDPNYISKVSDEDHHKLIEQARALLEEW